MEHLAKHQFTDQNIVFCFYRLQLGDTSLPDTMPENWTDEEIQALHHVLFEVGLSFYVVSFGAAPKLTMMNVKKKKLHVEEGIMTCRGCGHAYPVSNGIPNMVSQIV